VTDVPPIRREILVDAGPQAAFEVFTARLGRWWPVAGHSVYGAGATVAFEDGQLVERAADGRRAVWGTVTRWEPPSAVAFSWHPGRPADAAGHVEVTFAAAGPQTLVTLEHSGWEAYADPAATRAEYDLGWPVVLQSYADDLGQPGADEPGEPGEAGEPGETWVALLHRPGPAAPADGSVLEDPRFGEHVAFLGRMRAAGYLVAAGPLTDADGDGMTILRLPGAGRLAEATRLARQDDASVAGGFFAVTVRPWQVVMQSIDTPAGGS
jgi:uncharacterized protein YciI